MFSQRSFKGRIELEKAEKCGCFYCLHIYSPKDVIEYVDNKLTAICPLCGIDSVVGYDPLLDNSIEEFKRELRIQNLLSFS